MGTLTPAKDEFRRVSFTGTYARLPDVMVYSSGSSVRNDVSGPGTWAFLPAQTADGATVVVNAGFVQNTMQDRAQEDRAVGRLITGEPVKLTGYLRFPEAAGTLTPRRIWPSGSGSPAIICDGARARLGRGRQRVAPFYIDLESPVPESGIPKPGPLRSVSRTTTCNTPSPGSAWRPRW